MKEGITNLCQPKQHLCIKVKKKKMSNMQAFCSHVFKCGSCNESFFTTLELLTHVKDSHDNIPSSVKESLSFEIKVLNNALKHQQKRNISTENDKAQTELLPMESFLSSPKPSSLPESEVILPDDLIALLVEANIPLSEVKDNKFNSGLDLGSNQGCVSTILVNKPCTKANRVISEAQEDFEVSKYDKDNDLDLDSNERCEFRISINEQSTTANIPISDMQEDFTVGECDNENEGNNFICSDSSQRREPTFSKHERCAENTNENAHPHPPSHSYRKQLVNCDIFSDSCGNSSASWYKFNGKYLVECGICKQCFSSIYKLSQHFIAKRCSAYRCPYCHESFGFHILLLKHVVVRHVEDYLREGELYKCLYCSETFNQKMECVQHIADHAVNKPFVCKICRQDFHSHIMLFTHLESAHTVDKASHPSKATSNSSSQSRYREFCRARRVKKALERVKRPSEINFECKTCGKTFQWETMYLRHERVHSGVRAFQCEKCNKRFKEKSSLKNHMKVHMPDKPYKCPLPDCPFAARHKSSLKTHIDYHSGIKRYQCPHCGKSFFTSFRLKLHIKALHSGDKDFMCAICGKCFSLKPLMDSHMRTHTLEKPFSCPVCNKSFAGQSNRTSHVRKVHPEYKFQTKQKLQIVPGISYPD